MFNLINGTYCTELMLILIYAEHFSHAANIK